MLHKVDERCIQHAVGFNQGETGIFNASITYIPDPATATLSMLALAGLAVRRRRK
ncbi:MAG: PEP-CTERM sorting domain-containing protein [Akkermansia sp.]|nr:PEP-CTERM sorting domain-containing protein [Akkermansia sp.]